MQQTIAKAPRMSQPTAKPKGATGVTGPTGRGGTGEKKKINENANDISQYKEQYMYDDKGNKYPISSTTTSGGTGYRGKLYKADPKARIR
jgi:hypothetical protein